MSDDQIDLADLAERVQRVFEQIHREQFLGEPIANPRIKVDVVDPEVVEGIPTLVLVAPWTVNGMAFVAKDVAPPSGLTIGGRPHPLFPNEVEGVGYYWSVNLLGDPSRLESPEQARQKASMLAKMFREAVARYFGKPEEQAAPASEGDTEVDEQELIDAATKAAEDGIKNVSRRRLFTPWAE